MISSEEIEDELKEGVVVVQWGRGNADGDGRNVARRNGCPVGGPPQQPITLNTTHWRSLPVSVGVRLCMRVAHRSD